MFEIIQSSTFSDWLNNLKDYPTKMRIHARLDRVRMGNFGDAQSIGEGLSELRIHCGAGYRLYYMQRGMQIVVMLCGGDKSSQSRDIAQAKIIAKAWKE